MQFMPFLLFNFLVTLLVFFLIFWDFIYLSWGFRSFYLKVYTLSHLGKMPQGHLSPFKTSVLSQIEEHEKSYMSEESISNHPCLGLIIDTG